MIFVNKIAPNVFLLYLEDSSSNAYLLFDEKLKKAVVIDSGMGGKAEWDALLNSLNISYNEVELVLITHSHYDHVSNNAFFPNATIAANAKALNRLETNDPKTFLLDSGAKYSDSGKHRVLKDNEVVSFGGFSIKVFLSPGHTMDSACYFEEHSGVFFAGDTVFPKGGLPRIFDGSKELLKRSYDRIEKEVVGKGKILAPGHGEPGGFVEEFEAAQNALGFI